MFQSVQKAVYSVRNKPVCEVQKLVRDYSLTRIRHISNSNAMTTNVRLILIER